MEINTRKSGRIAYLTLDKPETLNALTETMIDELADGLNRFEADSSVEAIVINSSSAKAFCAGGDMKRIRQLSMTNDIAAIDAFFEKEYALNLAISKCSKPYIAIIDGVAMGGGLGLSIHGSHCIVTERAMMAMPETRIGFFPDVGGSYFLPKLNHDAGRWIAMTAAAVRASEIVATGLGTHFVNSDTLEALLNELESPDGAPIHELIERHAVQQNDSDYLQTLKQRSDWFSHPTAQEVRHALQEEQQRNKDAEHLLELLDGASPYSIKVTLALLAETDGLSLEECLHHEKIAAMDAAFHPDFIEGVRAVLVDKDRNPHWQIN